jgi:phage-related protein
MYGGTKEEMERLIDDANELAIAQGLVDDSAIKTIVDEEEVAKLMEKVSKAEDDVAKKTNALEKAHISYNDALAKYGEGSSQARKALLSTQTATENLTNAQAKLAEMQNSLAQAQEGTQTAFDMNNFGDVIQAINLIQTQIGITGTTAEEAEGTLEGSTKAMAASWDNLKTAIASGDMGMLETSISALIDGTKTFIGNAAPVIKRIFEGIGTAVQELAPILQTELPKLINDLFPTLLSSAVSLVTTLVSSLGDTLPNLLKGLFNGDMLSQLFDSGGTLLTSLLNGLQSIAELIKENLPSFIQTLGNALVSGSKILLESAVTIVTTLADAILNSSDSFFAVISDMIKMLGDFLVDALPVLIPKAFELVYGLIEALASSDIFGQLTLVITPILTALADGLMKAAPIVYDKLPKIIENIFNTVTTYMNEHGDEWFAQLETLVTTLINGIIDLTPLFLEGIAHIVESLVVGVGEYIPALIDRIKSFFGIESFTESGNNIINGISNALSNGVEIVKEKAKAIFDNIVEWVEQLPERVGYFFTYTLGTIIQWAIDAPETAKTAASNLYDGIVEWVKQVPDMVKTFLTETLPKVVEWGLDLREKGLSAAKDLFNVIVTKVQELPDKMLEIGGNIVAGIWDGITNAKQWLNDRITGFCDGLVNGFKDSLGIHSPSTLMRDEIGKYLAQGIGVGFNNEMPDVVNDMTNALQNGIDSEMKNVNGFDIDAEYSITMLDIKGIQDMINELTKAKNLDINAEYVTPKKQLDDELESVIKARYELENSLPDDITEDLRKTVDVVYNMPDMPEIAKLATQDVDIDAEYSITMLDIKGIQDMVSELTKAKNLDINAEYEPPKNQLDDELESVIKARYELENSLPDDITEDLRKTVNVAYNMPDMPEIPKLATQDVDIKYVPTNMPEIPKQLETIARVEQVPDISRYEAPESIRQAPQSKAEKPIINNVFNISLALEGVKIASEIDVDEMTDEAVEKLSEKLEYLDVFGARSRGGSATV